MSTHEGKRKTMRASVALIVVTIVLAAVTLGELSSLQTVSAEAQTRLGKRLVDGVAAVDLDRTLNGSKALADRLKEANLFVTQPPKQHPVRDVVGILGDQALINGTWYGIGGRIADAVLVAVEPTQVTIRWQDQEKTFAPIAVAPDSERPARFRSSMRRPQGSRPVRSSPVVAESRRIPGGISVKDREEKMRRKGQSASEAQQKKLNAATNKEVKRSLGERGGKKPTLRK